MSISYTPLIFGGSADIRLKLSDSSVLADYAFRPSGTAYGQLCKHVTEFSSSTIQTVGQYGLSGMSALKTLKLPNCTEIGTYGLQDADVLEDLELPNVISLGTYALETSSLSAGQAAPLTVIELPRVQTIGTYAFRYRQTLESVTLGSVGNPVTSIAANAFNSCTQSTLSIIIYTSDGSALSGSPWGATSANIEYRAA